MPESTPPESSAQGKPAESDGAEVEQKKSAEWKAETDKLQKQLQGQSAVIRRLTEALEKLEKGAVEAAKPEEKPKGPLAAKLAELDAFKAGALEEKKQAEAKLERSRMRGLRESIQRQIAEAGADPVLSKVAMEALVSRVSGKVVFADNDGEETVSIRDGEDTHPLSDFIAGFMATDEGKSLIPQKAAPSLSGLVKSPAGSSAKTRISKADLQAGRFTLEDVVAGRAVVIDA